MATSTWGGQYGILLGRMDRAIYPSCGPLCSNDYIRAFATTSASSLIATPPVYQEFVAVHHRVLDPTDAFNKCKEDDELFCWQTLKTCTFSGYLQWIRDYWVQDAETYYIAKTRGRYFKDQAAPGGAKLFVNWPFDTPTGTLEPTGYFFRGRRASTEPNICANHNFTSVVPDDDDPSG